MNSKKTAAKTHHLKIYRAGPNKIYSVEMRCYATHQNVIDEILKGYDLKAEFYPRVNNEIEDCTMLVLHRILSHMHAKRIRKLNKTEVMSEIRRFEVTCLRKEKE